MTITTSATGSTSSSGLVSGIDSSTIITSLIAAERNAIVPTETRKTTAKSDLAVVQAMNKLFLYVATDAECLQDASTFSSKAAASGDEDQFTATATSTAAAGTYQVRVDALAQAEQIIGSAVTTDAEFSGTFTVSVGDGATFSYDADGSTLAEIAAAINQSSTAGVTAEIVDVGDGSSRLMLTADDSGAANTITLGGTLASSGPFATTTVTTEAQDASITLRIGSNSTVDVTRTSATNSLQDVVAGVKLALTGTSDSFASLTVSSDTSTAKDGITTFVTTLNEALQYYNENSAYDSTTETKGALFTAGQVRNQITAIKNAIDFISSNSTSFESIGLTFDSSTGLYVLDSSTLSSALASDSDAVASLFIDSGLGKSINDSLAGLTDSESGALTGMEDNLNDSITSYTKRISDFDALLEQHKERYQAQFTAMETAISSLETQKKALTAFTDALSKNSD